MANAKSTYEETKKIMKDSYPETHEIRKDLESLKQNVSALGKHLQMDGSVQANRAVAVMKSRLEGMRKHGREQAHNMAEQVRAKPGQYVALAFAAGLIAAFGLRRK